VVAKCHAAFFGIEWFNKVLALLGGMRVQDILEINIPCHLQDMEYVVGI
ncbi:hypothetical protein HKBW3S25_01057, partial [Candidatus Hakubella thermalkaliphila]